MTTLEIMAQVKEGKITEAEAAKLIEANTAATVKEAKKKKATIKVSNKGGIQFDGLRRFPITLYRDEWEIMDNMRDEVRAFIDKHKHQLAEKGGD